MRILDVLKRRNRRFYRSLVRALSVSLLTSLASYMGYFEGFEAKALDLLLWLREQIRLMDHLGASAKGNEKRLMRSTFS